MWNLIKCVLMISFSITAGSCFSVPTHLEPIPMSSSVKEIVKSRPEICSSLRKTPDWDSWDPVTDTYPDNTEWMECMGVGRR